MKTVDLMSRPVVFVHPEATLEEAASAMVQHQVGSVLVLDEKGRLLGIVTERQFLGQQSALPFSRETMPKVFGQWMDAEGLERIFAAARTTPVREVMTPATTVDESAPVEEVVQIMLERGIRHVAVLRQEVAVGVLSRHDLLRAFLRAGKQTDHP